MSSKNDSSQPNTKLINAILNVGRFFNSFFAGAALLIGLDLFQLGSRHLLLSGALMLILLGLLGSCVVSVINMLFLRIITLETALRELQGSSSLAKDTKHKEAS
jgi:hypothetical protein